MHLFGRLQMSYITEHLHPMIKAMICKSVSDPFVKRFLYSYSLFRRTCKENAFIRFMSLGLKANFVDH